MFNLQWPFASNSQKLLEKQRTRLIAQHKYEESRNLSVLPISESTYADVCSSFRLILHVKDFIKVNLNIILRIS